LDNTNISTLGKGKAPVSTNDIEAYNKETLNNEIRKLTATNTQLMTNKIKTEKTKVNLETDKIQLLDEKNSLVIKKEELWAEIAALNIINVLVRSHQNPFLRPIRDKFKTKRPLPFDNLKENLQKFFIRIRYYQRFYQQNLLFDFDKIQNIIINIIKDISK